MFHFGLMYAQTYLKLLMCTKHNLQTFTGFIVLENECCIIMLCYAYIYHFETF